MFCNEPDSLCENDSAVGVLKNIYGESFISAFINGGSPSAAIPGPTDIAPIILGGLATVAGMLAIVVFFSLIVTTLISSAQDGEAFGKGSAKSVIVFRFLFSIMLLMPTGSQYCIAQIILMGFVLWSNGETNKIYHNIVTASAMSSVGGVVADRIPPNSDPFRLREAGLAHFSQLYCYNLINANYFPTLHPDPSFNGAMAGNAQVIRTLKSESTGISSIYIPADEKAIRASYPVTHELDQAKKGSSVQIINLQDRSGTLNSGAHAVCGSLRVYSSDANSSDYDPEFDPNSMGMTLEEQRDIFKMIAVAGAEIASTKKDLMLLTTGVVSQWLYEQNVNFSFNSGAQMFSDEIKKIDMDKLMDRINKDVVLKSHAELEQIMATYRLKQATENLVGALTARGWTYAGGIKQRIISAQNGLGGNLNLPMVEFTEPQFSRLNVSDEREQLLNVAISMRDGLLKQATATPRFGEDSYLSRLSSQLPEEFSEDMELSDLTREMQSSYGSLFAKIKRGIVSYVLTGEYTQDPQAVLNSNTVQATWLDNDKDVLANIQRTGEFLAVVNGVVTSTHKTIWAKAIVAKGAAKISPFFSKIKTAIGEGVIDFLTHIIDPVVKKLIVYLDVLILYMAVIIPSMPYFFFITGVVAWYIHTLQAMAGLPFWAIMHMIPERSFVGSQTQGYVTVISLFLRPMLTLTGLFFGFILANPILFFITDAFFTMQESLMQNNSGPLGDAWQYVVEFFTFSNWLIVYCTLVLQICYMIFGLAGTLPDTVLRWLGSGLHAGGWGETQAQDALGGGAKAAQGGNDAVKRLKEAEDEAKRNKPGNDPRNNGGEPGGNDGGNGGNLASPYQPGIDDARAQKEHAQNAHGTIGSNPTPVPGSKQSFNTTQGTTPTFTPKANVGNQFLAMGGVTSQAGNPMDNKSLFKANKTQGQGGKLFHIAKETAIGFATAGKMGAVAGFTAGVITSPDAIQKPTPQSSNHYAGFGGKPTNAKTTINLGGFSNLPPAKKS